MAIIEDYDAISRRLHELLTASSKRADDIAELERWRRLARDAAQEYADNRRRERPRTDRSTGSASAHRQG